MTTVVVTRYMHFMLLYISVTVYIHIVLKEKMVLTIK